MSIFDTLDILASIPVNGKLSSLYGLSIYNPSVWGWIKRSFTGDGRAQTIIFLNEMCKEILIIDRDVKSVLRIKCAIDGLKNLRDTYFQLEDLDTTADIDSVIKIITDFII